MFVHRNRKRSDFRRQPGVICPPVDRIIGGRWTCGLVFILVVLAGACADHPGPAPLSPGRTSEPAVNITSAVPQSSRAVGTSPLGAVASAPAATPRASTTPRAYPTVQDAAGCYDDFATILNLGDRAGLLNDQWTVKPGEVVAAGWRVLNTGGCTWDSSYILALDDLKRNPGWEDVSPTEHVTRTIRPGEMLDLWISARVPEIPGSAKASWMLLDGKGRAIGEPLVLSLIIAPGPTGTPEPRAWISAYPEIVKPREQVTISWSVKAVKAAYFYRLGQAWWEHPVGSTANRFVYPELTTTYELRIVNGDDSVETFRTTVRVENFDPPKILEFVIDPRKSIVAGQCVDIRWGTKNRVNRIGIFVNGDPLWIGLQSNGAIRHCPEAGDTDYELIVQGPGGEDRAEQSITVGK